MAEFQPSPSNPCEISRIPKERIQLTASTSLQGGKIPLGVIASIVKTGKISRRDSLFVVKKIDEAMTKESGEML